MDEETKEALGKVGQVIDLPEIVGALIDAEACLSHAQHQFIEARRAGAKPEACTRAVGRLQVLISDVRSFRHEIAENL